MIRRTKNKLKLLREDPHMREVARGTLLAFVLKLGGSGLAFAFNVAVARLMGAEGAGLYFLALAVTTIGSVIGRVGLDNALLRFVASRAVHEDWAGVKGVYALGVRMAIAVSAAITLVIFLSAPWMASALFKKPELAEPLRWMSLSILPFALLNLQANSLKGLKRIRDAMLVQGVGVPLVGLALIVPFAGLFGAVGVSVTYFLSTVVIAVLGAWAWRKAIAENAHVTGAFPAKELWESCRPLFMVSFLNLAVLPWMPLFLLGIWATSEEVGIFGAALRVAALVSFMLTTINNVVAPKFAELHAKGNIEALRQTAQRSALLITLLASPLLLALIFGGHWVMAIYGREFEQGALVLAILAAGQFVNAYTGSVGFVLMMGGQEGATGQALIYSVLFAVVLCLLLIPSFGMVGAAIAVTLAGLLKNALLVRYCIRTMNIVPVPFLKSRK